MTVQEIRAYIDADRQERARRQRMYDYYRFNNRILEAPERKDDKPDNRLAHGFVAYISNAYTGYMFGKPVTYAAKAGSDEEEEPLSEQLLEAADRCFTYNDEQAENTALGLDCAICGVAVELLYTDADGAVRFARVDPVGCIDVRDGTIENALTALIRYYDRYDVVTGKTMRTVEVYDESAVTVYRFANGEAEFGEPEVREHFFGDVPAVVYKNNLFGMGDAEGVLSLIDAYDKMQSEGLNDQEYFSDAYLALYGIGDMDKDDAADMRRKRTLLMPDGSKAEWLIKQQSDATPQNIKERLNADIHRFSACPDMSDENFAGNASGVALSYKLLQFENVAGIKEREFKRGLQRRIELLCNIWKVLGAPKYDWREIQISFHRALPQNLLEISQTIVNLRDVLSDETKRSMLPLDIDEGTEKQRMAEQNEGGLFTAQEWKTGSVTDVNPPGDDAQDLEV